MKGKDKEKATDPTPLVAKCTSSLFRAVSTAGERKRPKRHRKKEKELDWKRKGKPKARKEKEKNGKVELKHHAQ